jgi:hypothetical protein
MNPNYDVTYENGYKIILTPKKHNKDR